MLNFSFKVFNSYSLNITKFRTLPSLALGVYTSSFYDENKNTIKMIKGKVEEEIRHSYFGAGREM